VNKPSYYLQPLLVVVACALAQLVTGEPITLPRLCLVTVSIMLTNLVLDAIALWRMR
jgi:hypothetical protein